MFPASVSGVAGTGASVSSDPVPRQKRLDEPPRPLPRTLCTEALGFLFRRWRLAISAASEIETGEDARFFPRKVFEFVGLADSRLLVSVVGRAGLEGLRQWSSSFTVESRDESGRMARYELLNCCRES
jgi:hypothetical protein